jgi:hypothetical protein
MPTIYRILALIREMKAKEPHPFTFRHAKLYALLAEYDKEGEPLPEPKIEEVK